MLEIYAKLSSFLCRAAQEEAVIPAVRRWQQRSARTAAASCGAWRLSCSARGLLFYEVGLESRSTFTELQNVSRSSPYCYWGRSMVILRIAQAQVSTPLYLGGFICSHGSQEQLVFPLSDSGSKICRTIEKGDFPNTYLKLPHFFFCLHRNPVQLYL